MNIHQATDLYLAEAARQGKSPRTRDRYRRHFEKLGDMYPHYDVDEVTTVMIRRYLDRWQTAAPATSAQIISMLRASSAGSPAKASSRPTQPSARAAEASRGPKNRTTSRRCRPPRCRGCSPPAETWTERLALHVLAYTGARRGAVAQLRLRDYDRDAGELTFREKGGKTIVKPIPADLRGLLDSAIDTRVYDSGDDYLVPPEHRSAARPTRRQDHLEARQTRRRPRRHRRPRPRVPGRVRRLLPRDEARQADRAAVAARPLEPRDDPHLPAPPRPPPGDGRGSRPLVGFLRPTFEVLPAAEKEGFEPSFDGLAGAEPKDRLPEGNG
jgi:integrase